MGIVLSVTARQALAIKRSTYPINIWVGSVRSGKTHGSLWVLLRVMAERKRSGCADGVVLIVGLSTNTVWRNIFQPLLTHKDFAHVAPHVVYRQNAPSGTIFGMPFSVVGGHDESSWLSIQGMTVAFCLGDEMTSWPQSFWDMLLTRFSLPTSWLLGTCNPGTSNHYLKKLIDSGDPDVHVETMLLRDNPTLPESFLQRLERTYSGLFYLRMILAQWVAAEGAVYQQWEPQKMVHHIDPTTIRAIISVGIDYGTNHPTAGYALGVTHQGGLVICAEWSPNLSTGSHRRLTDTQLADDLQEWLQGLPHQPRFIYCDPAAASFREELHARRVKTTRADNKVVDGIRTVDSLLNSGALHIADTCTGLINEIPGYRWDVKATERGKDAPIKENDDHCDALRYAVHSSRHLWRKYLQHATSV